MCVWCVFFFFNDTATTEIYTLSLHDALPIYAAVVIVRRVSVRKYYMRNVQGENHIQQQFVMPIAVSLLQESRYCQASVI